MDGEDYHAQVSLNDLHHRIHEVRDHLFMGETLLLTRRGDPLALIMPVEDGSQVPEDALVRSISYIRSHKKEFVFKLQEGRSIVLVYRGKKAGIVAPEERFRRGYPG
jgi:antitoxin (DNA-binding transcriptional repressor) of toxin-antitoxin stability system